MGRTSGDDGYSMYEQARMKKIHGQLNLKLGREGAQP